MWWRGGGRVACACAFAKDTPSSVSTENVMLAMLLQYYASLFTKPYLTLQYSQTALRTFLTPASSRNLPCSNSSPHSNDLALAHHHTPITLQSNSSPHELTHHRHIHSSTPNISHIYTPALNLPPIAMPSLPLNSLSSSPRSIRRSRGY